MADLDTRGVTLTRAAPPSAGFVRTGATLEVEAFLGVGKIQLLGREAPAIFEKAVGRAPPRTGGSISSGALVFSWLAPGEWLVTGREADVQAVLERADLIAGDSGLATNLSHAQIAFVLSGQYARDVLAALTPLDASETAIPVGGVARAPLGDVGMFLARLPDLGEEPSFRIIVDQTNAAYAVRMLAGPEASAANS